LNFQELDNQEKENQRHMS